MASRSPHLVAKLRVYEPHKGLLERFARDAGLTPSGFANVAVQAVVDGTPLPLRDTLTGIEQAQSHLLAIRLDLTRIANDVRAQHQTATTPVLLVMLEQIREEIAEQCKALAAHLTAMQPHRAQTA